ncbi:hypothetical protein R1flu_013765 [Riccia fluitans]|uniref:Uncharacterized protein n=1 Tax=Riccia fluitans TaxID=41844 RepID=A0ABD1YHP1_9MARC
MKWLSLEEEKKLGFMIDKDKEIEDEDPSSPKAEKVRAKAEEVPQEETSAKAPEEEKPDTMGPVPDEEDTNAKVEQE